MFFLRALHGHMHHNCQGREYGGAYNVGGMVFRLRVSVGAVASLSILMPIKRFRQIRPLFSHVRQAPCPCATKMPTRICIHFCEDSNCLICTSSCARSSPSQISCIILCMHDSDVSLQIEPTTCVELFPAPSSRLDQILAEQDQSWSPC